RFSRDWSSDVCSSDLTPVSSTAEKIDQSVYFVDKALKPKLLLKVLTNPACERVLVFSRTKHGANRIATALEKARISAAAIHGNRSEERRVGKEGRPRR